METALAVIEPAQAPELRQADTDAQVVAQWLGRSKSPATRRNYERISRGFLEFVSKPLRSVTVSDAHAWQVTLEHHAPATQAQAAAAIKSLFNYAHRIGWTPFNIGPEIPVPSVPDTLAERILDEATLQELIRREPNTRNRLLLVILYGIGARAAELSCLLWRHTTPKQPAGGLIQLFGKGGKSRNVLVASWTWKALQELRGNAGPDDPVLPSREGSNGGKLSERQVRRIVAAAGARVGVNGLSPHWLRHCFASHALTRKADIRRVQADLGHGSLETTMRYLHANPEDGASLYLQDPTA